MNESTDIYTQLGIDKSRLKRDYIENPLKRGEKPFKEDIEYLFIQLNMSLQNLSNFMRRHKTFISKVISSMNIKKDKKLIYEIRKQTNFQLYGVVNLMKAKSSILKSKLTKKLRYGNENYNNRSKAKNTMLYKYGVDIYSKLEESKIKQYNTLCKNGTIGKSKEEDKIYEPLCQKYKEVKRQYKSDVYPFACDFYIPEIDIYIEYQGFWTHGKEPYIGTDNQKEKVKLWESKNTSQYIKAIDDWTNRDVLKRETAKKNNLNWLEFFTMNEFMVWFNKQ